jgi:hypothetical protein
MSVTHSAFFLKTSVSNPTGEPYFIAAEASSRHKDKAGKAAWLWPAIAKKGSVTAPDCSGGEFDRWVLC